MTKQFLACMVIFCNLISNSSFATQSFDSSKADSIVSQYLKSEDFSGNVLVAQDGVIQFQKSYGLASRQLNVANTKDSKLVIGSVSKQFTAAAIMKLVESGKLDVQNKISDIISGAPTAWKDITIHHLLTHAAGFRHELDDVAGFKDGDDGEVLKFHSLKQLVEYFKLSQLTSPPGTTYSYSNIGYSILARVVEIISSQDFVEYLESEIFKPTGLTNTGVFHPVLVIDRLSSGYMKIEGQTINAYGYEPANGLGACNVYSTTEDLLKWEQILKSGSFFKPKTNDEIFTPWNKMSNNQSYGYGWVVEEINGQRVTWHNGLQNGYSSALYRYANGRTVIVLSNMYKTSVDDIARKLGAL